MGNQCINKSLPNQSARNSVNDDVMEAERDAIMRKRKDIRKNKKEVIQSQLALGEEMYTTGDTTPGQQERQNEETGSSRSGRKKRNMSNSNLKKQSFKEDEEGFESPIKRQQNLDELVFCINTPNSFQDSHLQNQQTQNFRSFQQEDGDYSKKFDSRKSRNPSEEDSSLPGTFIEQNKDNNILEKKSPQGGTYTYQEFNPSTQNNKKVDELKYQNSSGQGGNPSQTQQNNQQAQSAKEKEKKKSRKSIKANKKLIDNPQLKKIQKEIDQETKHISIPIENYDSDQNCEELQNNVEDDDPNLPDLIVQKAYSIGGIRKYNYIFKKKRRDNLGDALVFQDNYLMLCSNYLSNIQSLLRKNLESIRVKLCLEIEEFEKHLSNADLQYSSLQGLGKRMEIPVLDQMVAQDLHQKIKTRVLDLWRENQARFQAKNYDMDIVLQSLQCYAEDMLYFESGLEIEQLHRVVYSGLNLSSCGEDSYDSKNVSQHASQRKGTYMNGIRLSIFTIDEENSGEDEEFKQGEGRKGK